MKGKWKKRVLSLMLTAGMILGGITAMPEDSDLVSAADITNDQPSWFISNSATNPHAASNWTCFYGKNGSFFKMTAREGESGKYIWHPENVTDTAYVHSYAMQSTQDAWTALGYYVSQTGTATCMPYSNTTVHANGSSSELMIVLRSGDTGRYYPLYPSKGVWEWKTVTGNAQNPDIANGTTIFEASVKKGDTIFYVSRPSGDQARGYINLVPQIALTDDSTALTTYPERDAFTGWENRAADDSLYAPTLSFDVSAEKYQPENIRYGGLGRIESVPREGGGTRLWATANAGGTGESPEVFILFYYSDDNGETWSDAVMVNDYDTVFGRRNVRAQDHSLFYNEQTGKLWLLVTGSTGWYDGRFVTYLTMIDNPGAANVKDITWSEPRLLMDKHEVLTGISNSRPALLSDGTIVIPLWNEHYVPAGFAEPNKLYTPANVIPERYQVASAILTDANATSFTRAGGAALSDPSKRLFDETSIYQKDMSNPNELVMVSRVRAGLAAFESHDKGVTWTQMEVPNNSNTFNFWADNGEKLGTCSNFVLQRLDSGNLLMVYYDDTTGQQNRIRLVARISTDNGVTWSGGLLLGDGSYPYATQTSDGTIHVVYDKTIREIYPRMYHTAFTEADVLAGDSITMNKRNVVCRYTGEPVFHKTRSMKHSGLYAKYAEGLTAEDAHSSGEADIAEFWYKYGSRFNFENLTIMEAAPYWRNESDTNRVAAWYLTAQGELDTAICWRSLSNANVTYSTGFGDVYLTKASGSADVMIVQKRGDKYYPLWPVKGEFQWKTIKDAERVSLSGENAVTTAVKPYDEIMVVLRAGSAQITIDPSVSYTTKEADSTIVIDHLADALFLTYDELNPDLQPTTVSITVKAGEGGTITQVSGSNNVGDDISYEIKPKDGYKIADVLVDGVSVGAVSRYTFTDLKEDHTLEAKFENLSGSGSGSGDSSGNNGSSGNGTSGGSGDNSKPKTGDPAKPAALSVLMLLAAAALTALLVAGKKKGRNV